MVIGNSQLNMESARSFKATSNQLSAFVTGASASITKVSRSIESSFKESHVTDDKGKYDSFDSSLKNASKAENAHEADEAALGGSGFNLGRRRLLNLNRTDKNAERMNARKVREQTLIYLLLRLKRMLTGEETPKDGVSELYGLAEGSGGNGANYGASSGNQDNAANSSNIIGYRINEATYEESEQTSFNTTGKVVTKDGREIDFDVSLKMSRSLSKAVSSISQIAATATGSLVDPLVINLDSNPATISDQKFFFDLNQDGKEESISMPTEGSGFLAIDLNGDGIINDGSELFGTKSGDGFNDLARYDSDGNGWIDEADEVFDKLLIWTKDEDGNDMLYKLKDKDIGALCLEHVKTDFSIKNDNNTLGGMIRNTGFFLYEDGRAGTLQHLDLAT